MGIKLVDILANLIDASFFKESYTFSIYHYHVPVLMRTFSCLIQHDFYKELPLRQGMQAMVEVVTDERRLIELLHPGFERRLRAAVKNLIGTQYQLCLLIRLGFDNNKELGDMLGVAPQSIAKYKQRLRSRIIEKGLPTITWVLQFIHNI